MSANNDSIQKTLIVAVLLCLVCAIIVAGAAVSLKPLQVANKVEDKKKTESEKLQDELEPIDESES